MQHQDIVTVEDQPYLITQMSPTKALNLLVRLLKLAGPSIKELISDGGLAALTDEKAKEERLDQIVGAIISGLMQSLDERMVDGIVKELLAQVHVENVPVTRDFDARFQGQLFLIFRLCAASLKVQYGDFGSALGQLANAGLIRKKARS